MFKEKLEKIYRFVDLAEMKSTPTMRFEYANKVLFLDVDNQELKELKTKLGITEKGGE